MAEVRSEIIRQKLVRAFEAGDEIEECAKLYEKGWTLAEIAQSKDVPIDSLIKELRSYISIKPEDIAAAEEYARLERRGAGHKM